MMQGWTMSNTAIRSMRLKKKCSLSGWWDGQTLQHEKSWTVLHDPQCQCSCFQGSNIRCRGPWWRNFYVFYTSSAKEKQFHNHQPPWVISGYKTMKFVKFSQRSMVELMQTQDSDKYVSGWHEGQEQPQQWGILETQDYAKQSLRLNELVAPKILLFL